MLELVLILLRRCSSTCWRGAGWAIRSRCSRALLAFLGAAWEALLWPFDLHTIAALAAGLGALLALDRDGGPADGIACALLVVAITLIEVGVSSPSQRPSRSCSGPNRRTKWWVFAIPAGLFAAWYRLGAPSTRAATASSGT